MSVSGNATVRTATHCAAVRDRLHKHIYRSTHGISMPYSAFKRWHMQASHLGVKAGRIQRAGRQREEAQRMADLHAAPLLCEPTQLAS